MNPDSGTTYSFDICRKCKKNCCKDAKPPLTEQRKKMIEEYLENQKISFQKPFVKAQYSYIAVDEQIYCRLFDKKAGTCLVHSVKPETCVAGPITFDINFDTGKVEWFLKKSEICAYTDVLYNDNMAFVKHFEAAKKQLTSMIIQLGAHELRAIVKIDEPQTFKVGEDDLPIEVTKKLGVK